MISIQENQGNQGINGDSARGAREARETAELRNGMVTARCFQAAPIDDREGEAKRARSSTSGKEEGWRLRGRTHQPISPLPLVCLIYPYPSSMSSSIRINCL
ncbi:hypothetical protein Y032_0114g438 [Ancylostoma ceylanicum]|uniref:Uncharacterized protein n=1 Tax=Ancylostoma ceylanicum TaxID=53326 RepID=A0A016TD38_9BILA|nr:hypothetical protein Y032_0114g438 [Ancylostoma ceylanicum]